MTFGRLILAALVFVGLISIVRADDKKESPKAESIDFRKLKDWVPAELSGMKRSECNGERNKVGEISITQVSAKFKKDDAEESPRVELQIVDYSSMEMATGLAAAWASVEIDKESDSGFEKTIKVAGNPGFFTWKKEGKNAEVQLLVGKRFILNITMNNVPSEQVIKTVEALPLDKLTALK